MEEKIVCPICQSEKNKFFGEKNKYKLYRCIDCRLVFVWPIPGNLSTLYQEEYFKANEGGQEHGYTDYDQDKEKMKQVFVKYLERIEKLCGGRKIFDVGAATGFFLVLAKERGWQTAGTEISRYAAKVAQTKGENVVYGRLPEIKTDNKYDAVTMWDVLEHLDNPKEYVQAAGNLLLKGGLLVVNTIDKDSLWAKIWGKHWHLIVPPEHLFYYSRKSLEILFETSGFKIIKTEKIGKKFSLSYIFRILYNWQRFSAWFKLSLFFDRPWWRRFSIPINLRDNIFIIAKKIKDV